MTTNTAIHLGQSTHVISNHVNTDAKSARWSVSCSCGWSRSRFNSCASANQMGLSHQSEVLNSVPADDLLAQVAS